MEKYMQRTKFLTIATLVMASTLSFNAEAQEKNNKDNNYEQSVKTLKTAKNPNNIIVNTLFPNASPEEKKRIQAQIQQYSQIQYGFGTAAANPWPLKDEDVMNNIKSHNPEVVSSQIELMRKSAQELPHLQKVSPKTTSR